MTVATKDYFLKQFRAIKELRVEANAIVSDYERLIEELRSLSFVDTDGFNNYHASICSQIEQLEDELNTFTSTLDPDHPDTNNIHQFLQDLTEFRENAERWGETFSGEFVQPEDLLDDCQDPDELEIAPLPDFPDDGWGYDWSHRIENNLLAALFTEAQQTNERTFFFMPPDFKFATVDVLTHVITPWETTTGNLTTQQLEHKFTLEVCIRCDHTTPTTTTTNPSSSTTSFNAEGGPTKSTPT
jgi:hypothetical protein